MLGSLNVREMHVSMIKGTVFLSFVQNMENMDMLPDVRRWIEGLRGSGEKDKEDKEAAAAWFIKNEADNLPLYEFQPSGHLAY